MSEARHKKPGIRPFLRRVPNASIMFHNIFKGNIEPAALPHALNFTQKAPMKSDGYINEKPTVQPVHNHSLWKYVFLSIVALI